MNSPNKNKDGKWEYNGIVFEHLEDAEKVAREDSINAGTSLEKDDFSGGKQKITMWADEELVKKYKELAKKRGTKYQTLMNEVLLQYLGDGERRLLDMKESEFKSYIKKLVS